MEPTHALSTLLTTDPEPDAPAWLADLARALDALAELMSIDARTDADFDEVVRSTEPRLAHAADRAAKQSKTLESELRSLAELARQATDSASLASVRVRAAELVGQVSRHRRADADLAHEVFGTDVGTGEGG